MAHNGLRVVGLAAAALFVTFFADHRIADAGAAGAPAGPLNHHASKQGASGQVYYWRKGTC